MNKKSKKKGRLKNTISSRRCSSLISGGESVKEQDKSEKMWSPFELNNIMHEPHRTNTDLVDTVEKVKFHINLLVDREQNKVVFAEAGSDFIDTLFSFLTLPMGTIVRILDGNIDSQLGAIRSFCTLYKSVDNLDAKHLWSDECKQMLLSPRNAAEAECLQLKLNLDGSGPTTYYICEDWGCSRNKTALLSTYSTTRCSCGKLMNRGISVNVGSNVKNVQGKGGVFAIEMETYIVSDDLHIYPKKLTAAIELLKKCGLKDLNAFEERTLDIGYMEMLKLLKFCLLRTDSPLTEAFLCNGVNGVNVPPIVQPKVSPLAGSQTWRVRNTTEDIMTVKIVFQTSSNRVLFAQAEKNFVDFLFSLLTIPLGGVACLLSGKISVGSVSNLYQSVLTLNSESYIKSQEVKEMLRNPRLAPLYLCKNQIFCLNEGKTPQYYCLSNIRDSKYIGCLVQYKVNSNYEQKCTLLTLKNPKIEEEYIRSPAMFMVTDDLDVSPFSAIAGISIMQQLKIAPSDVEEQVVSIGMEEALKILKATLESTSVLSNAFSSYMPKQPKQMH